MARTSRGGLTYARRRSGATCPPGQEPCPAVPSCCDPGWTCADPKTHACCPNDRKYCGSGATATCCPPGYDCLQNKSCCPAGKGCGPNCCLPWEVCHRGKCHACARGTRKCGTKSCCKGKERCCGQVCCKHDQGCCGDICCDKGQHCCEGKICCNHGEQCCGEDCCGGHTQCAIEPGGKQVCCHNLRAAHIGGNAVVCCPPGYVADASTGDRCCPADNPRCAPCTPACGAGEYCRGGLCFPLA